MCCHDKTVYWSVLFASTGTIYMFWSLYACTIIDTNSRTCFLKNCKWPSGISSNLWSICRVFTCEQIDTEMVYSLNQVLLFVFSVNYMQCYPLITIVYPCITRVYISQIQTHHLSKRPMKVTCVAPLTNQKHWKYYGPRIRPSVANWVLLEFQDGFDQS